MRESLLEGTWLLEISALPAHLSLRLESEKLILDISQHIIDTQHASTKERQHHVSAHGAKYHLSSGEIMSSAVAANGNIEYRLFREYRGGERRRLSNYLVHERKL